MQFTGCRIKCENFYFCKNYTENKYCRLEPLHFYLLILEHNSHVRVKTITRLVYILTSSNNTIKINKITVKLIFVSFYKQLTKNCKKGLGLVTSTHFVHNFHEK